MDGSVFEGCERYARGFRWPAWLEESLRALWSSGQTASEIAKELGITKNMVVAKARRLNLAVRRPQNANRMAPTPQKFNVTLEDWPARNQCAFPLGDLTDPGFHFCKEPTEHDGANYCSHHRRICSAAKAKVAA